MYPNSLIVRSLLLRSGIIWIAARLIGGAVIALGQGDPLRLSFAATVFVVVSSFVLGLVDIRRRHERALLENLAVARVTLVVLLSAPAVVGEGILALAMRVLD